MYVYVHIYTYIYMLFIVKELFLFVLSFFLLMFTGFPPAPIKSDFVKQVYNLPPYPPPQFG